MRIAPTTGMGTCLKPKFRCGIDADLNPKLPRSWKPSQSATSPGHVRLPRSTQGGRTSASRHKSASNKMSAPGAELQAAALDAFKHGTAENRFNFLRAECPKRLTEHGGIATTTLRSPHSRVVFAVPGAPS